MSRRWLVTCQVNLCADKEITVIIKANTERKAKSLAMKWLHKEGYFAVGIISCKNITGENGNESKN